MSKSEMTLIISPGDITPPELARRAVESFVRHREIIDEPENAGILSKIRAGAFVSLKTRDGHLRGCIGTIEPDCENLAREIIRNAVHAATLDPRFVPVHDSDLAGLVYSVDVLHATERVNGPHDLDPKRYGVIIESRSGRRALLLPDLHGLDTVEKQLAAARQKAGLSPIEPISIERFTVQRFTEDARDQTC